MQVIKIKSLDDERLSELADRILELHRTRGGNEVALQFKTESDFRRYRQGVTPRNLGSQILKECPHELTEEQMLSNILGNRDGVSASTYYNSRKRQVIYKLSVSRR